MTGILSNTYDAKTMTESSQASTLQVFFRTPTYNSATNIMTISDTQIVGSEGTIYFIAVLYKTIVLTSNSTYVNIKLNYVPTAEQIMNCQNW